MNRPKRLQITWRLSSSSTPVAHHFCCQTGALARFWRGGIISTVRGNATESTLATSASPSCLDRGNVDLLHRHHRLEGTLCLTAACRKRIG